MSGSTVVTGLPHNAAAITPSDSADLSTPMMIWVNGAGTVAVIPAGGQSTVTYTMPAASVVPVRVKRVLATGTTATGLVGHW